MEFIAEFFNNLINGVFYLIGYVVNLVLTPFDLLISNYFPSISNVIDFLNTSIEAIFDFVQFAVSFLGISDSVFIIIKGLIIYIITVPILALSVKLAVKWYNALKVG